jgi:hypothetical protein
MKVQIQSQSLRLRIDESELARLLAGEVLENQTWLGAPGVLSQRLQLHDTAEAMLDGDASVLIFKLPRDEVQALPARLPCRDGLSFTLQTEALPLQLQFDVDVRDSVRQRGVQRRSSVDAVSIS